MKLSEMRMMLCDTVIVYSLTDKFDSVELYKGELYDAPHDVLDKEVRYIFARRKDILSICVV